MEALGSLPGVLLAEAGYMQLQIAIGLWI